MAARLRPTPRALRATDVLALPFLFLLTLTAPGIHAESVSVIGAPSATGSARLNVAVVVPKIAALSIGTAGAAVDAVTFTVSATGTAANTNSQQASGANANWSGAAAPVLQTSGPFGVTAQAYANVTGSTLTCSATGNGGATTAIAASGSNVPILSNITVASGGTLAHPGASIACGTTVTLTAGTVYSNTWTYTLAGTLAIYKAGSYGTGLTYTAATP